MVHTILGAGGPVSNALCKELIAEGKQVRLVSRRKVASNASVHWAGADLLVKEQVVQSVKGSAVVYLCAGLRYDKQVWAKEWPILISNVIEACKISGSRLIFFDNVYMYGKVQGEMTESTPYNPISRKGEIRAKVAETLMKEFSAGNLQGSIARAADFYGAESMNSFYDSMVLAKFVNKEKALWLGNPNTLHTFTYIPDTGKALAILGNDHSSDGEIWHIPSDKARTGKEFLELAAQQYNVPVRYMKVNKVILKTLGLFVKMLNETAEVYYQYEFDYLFNSQKFTQTFGLRPTSYQQGIKEFSLFLLKQKDKEATALQKVA